MEPRRAERDHDGQRRLRSVGGGAEAIEPHRRDARDPADPTLFAFAVGEATAEEEVDDLHGGGHAQVA